MVSVLISAYNYDPSGLVEDLLDQLQRFSREFEILIGNDCSDSNFMPVFDALEAKSNVRVFNSDKNLGRSVMRNRLAELSVYPYLLFIDGDASVKDDNFISLYLENADSNICFCGGTAYRNHKPEKEEEYLRWLYGIKRESRSAEERNKSPHQGFSSFNFLIPREVFLLIGFRDDLTEYGHEDTLFGIDLWINRVRVVHLDNSLIHEGLDRAEVFLAKTLSSVENLVYLEKTIMNPGLLKDFVSLMAVYYRLRKIGIHHFLSLFHKPFISVCKRRLLGHHPNIRYLDLYKLCLLNRYKY